ncbi:MAG: hypothetical protein ABIL04_03085 [candidate division WOR-3 bacterium]
MKWYLSLFFLSFLTFASQNNNLLPSAEKIETSLPETDQISIPLLLNYQGKLTDNIGNPVRDSSYSVTFRLFNVPSGGSPFWNETQTIQTRAGLFHTLLGSVNPITSLPLDGNLYLEMQVNPNPPMTPRVRIVSAAYSYLARRADSANYAQSAPLTRPITPPIANNEIADNAVTTGKILNGTILMEDLSFTPAVRPLTPPLTSDEISDNAINSAKILDLSITGSDIANNTIGQEKLNFTAGDITGVYAGTGLSGGGASGEVTLSFNRAYTDTAYIRNQNLSPQAGNFWIAGRGRAQQFYGVSATSGVPGIYGEGGSFSHGTVGVCSTSSAFGGIFLNRHASGTGLVVAGNGLNAFYFADGGGGTFTGNTGLFVKGITGSGVVAVCSAQASGGFANYAANHHPLGTALVAAGSNRSGYYFTNGGGGTFSGTTGLFALGKTADGMIGISESAGIGYAGVWGEGPIYTTGAFGVFGGAQNVGVYGFSTASPGIYGRSQANNGILGVCSTSAYAGVLGAHLLSGQFGVYASGNLGASGTKSALVRTSKGPTALYCLETPEVWFEDIGRGELINGEAYIQLDPLFLETVTIDEENPMEVFVQLYGNCQGVYVERGERGFRVVELNNGRSNAPFAYRVLAKRKGFENLRMEKEPIGYTDQNLYPDPNDPEIPFEIRAKRLAEKNLRIDPKDLIKKRSEIREVSPQELNSVKIETNLRGKDE